jgi:Holliday junction resolvase RusA-like endonuclease
MNAPDRSLAGMQVIDVQVPPPSTNHLFANVPGKGRVRSKRYLGWLNAAGWDVAISRARLTHGPVKVTLLVHRTNKRRDIDNTCKPLLDLLVKQGVLIDDSQVESLTVEWSDVVQGARIFIEPFRKEKAA